MIQHFFHFVTSQNLYRAVWLFGILTFFFVSASFFSLYYKKRKWLIQKRVEKRFELLISKAMLDDWEFEEDFAIPENFKRHISSDIKKQYAIDLLVNARKSLSGKAGENIIKLYMKLGLRNESLRKFKSGTWYIKTKGIYELFMMEQHNMLTQIYKYTNSKNDFIRMEAQAAIIHLSGFHGLRFLNVVSTPISEWQQIKLLELLRHHQQKNMPQLEKWLGSKNDFVVLFALKLAEVYQQYHVYDRVVDCMSHANEKIRIQAVKTLTKIAMDSTAELLADVYKKEAVTNKLNILNQLAELATEKETEFLEMELENENQFIKLAAARVIGERLAEGLNLLRSKADRSPQVFEAIYQQVKYEIS